MVGVSASVNLPLHHKVQKFSSGTGSPGWSREKCHKTVVVSGMTSLLQGVQRALRETDKDVDDLTECSVSLQSGSDAESAAQFASQTHQLISR